MKSGGEKTIQLDPLPKAFEPAPSVPPNVILEADGRARVLRRDEMSDASLNPRYLPHYAVCKTSRRERDRYVRRQRRLELEEDQLEALREGETQ